MLKRFSIQVSLRVVVILIIAFLLAYILGDERLFFNQVILTIALGAVVYNLIWYVHQTNRDVKRLLDAIKQSDFTTSFKQKKLGKNFSEMYATFDQILTAFDTVKIEKEAQYHFLQLLVEHIHVGILAIAEDGDITLVNNSAKEVLSLENIRSWAHLTLERPEFVMKIDEMGKSGSRLIELGNKYGAARLAVEVSSSRLLDQSLRLITFKDIENEIEQKELEAWHKLIRILTHEIMNSLTPVSSLTETMQTMLETSDGRQVEASSLTAETISDLRFSLNTIRKRSDEMLHFVDDYRKVTRVPEPVLQQVPSKVVIDQIVRLLYSDLLQDSIELIAEIEQFDLEIDQGLIDQILINLVKNSRHALVDKKNGKIVIRSYEDEKGRHIAVEDNGIGIEDELLKEIFIPFFTTKDSGSGIGLSLSKQIMSLHGGRIRVDSKVNQGTSVTLTFNK